VQCTQLTPDQGVALNWRDQRSTYLAHFSIANAVLARRFIYTISSDLAITAKRLRLGTFAAFSFACPDKLVEFLKILRGIIPASGTTAMGFWLSRLLLGHWGRKLLYWREGQFPSVGCLNIYYFFIWTRGGMVGVYIPCRRRFPGSVGELMNIAKTSVRDE